MRYNTVKAEQIVNHELVERLQEERSAAKRCSVYCFALLVTHRFFYDLNNEFCVFRSKVKRRIFQIFEKSIDSLFQFYARDLLSALDRVAVI